MFHVARNILTMRWFPIKLNMYTIGSNSVRFRILSPNKYWLREKSSLPGGLNRHGLACVPMRRWWDSMWSLYKISFLHNGQYLDTGLKFASVSKGVSLFLSIQLTRLINLLISNGRYTVIPCGIEHTWLMTELYRLVYMVSLRWMLVFFFVFEVR